MDEIKKIAITQPFIPHYRKGFFQGLGKLCAMDIFCYKNAPNSFCIEKDINTTSCRCFNLLFFDFFLTSCIKLRKYDVLILCAEIRNISVWLLLLLAKFYKCKVVLYGHGLSVKRYLAESIKIPFLRKLMYRLADGAWFYTKKECEIVRKSINIPSVALGNTISGVERILTLNPCDAYIENIKRKYKINTEINFIICARWAENNRHPEMFVEFVKMMDPEKYGFIVIGAGEQKPDFSTFSNVYDFGAVYENDIKDELFAVADIYFQPAWLGLSGVEAMAYGKLILTCNRTEVIHQCVELFFVEDSGCGIFVDTMKEAKDKIENLKKAEIKELGEFAKSYVQRNLTMDMMVNRAYSLIRQLTEGNN